MKPTPEAVWERVEMLAHQMGSLPADRLAAEISTLRASGESPTVLTLLSGMLELPPLPTGLAEGTVVGERYTLRSKIGEGGMGTVWRAWQANVGRDVALKMIHPALATPELRSRFKQEIEMLSRLDHPGIVKVFDAGIHRTAEFGETPYFAMELVEGEHLDKWAARTRPETADLLQAAAFLCLAIHSAHERQVVHRDLKPSNIIVKPGGQPVIMDFGIARLAGIAAGDEAHQFSGTPIYAAPEQHLGNDRDFRSGESVDVYAMGAIVFEMLTGRKLFDLPPKAPFADIRKAVLEAKPLRLSDVLPDCPPELDATIARAVRRNPADRFFSVAALGRALLRVGASVSDGQEEPPPWRPGKGETIPGTGWKLTEHLGSGSTGDVWLGCHAETGVVNVFKFCDSEDKVRSLKREATLFRLLKERVGRHPNLIQLHEVSLDEPPYYLMMERCEAKELGLWCEEQRSGVAGLPEEVRLEIVAQAADALQAAHEAGILHRDIKPANLLVSGDASADSLHVYVADFGIGQIVSDDLLLNGTLAGFTGTVSGSVSGSLRYLAPEVLEGNAATARSDIYSLGVVLWQLLIGNLNAALNPVDWASRIDDPLLRSDLARCLSGEPEHRWGSAAEFAASLRSLASRREGDRVRRAEEQAREQAAYRRGAIRSAAIVTAVLTVVVVSLAFAWKNFADSQRKDEELRETETRTAIAAIRSKADAHSPEAKPLLEKAMANKRMLKDRFERDFRDLATAVLALPTFSPIEPAPFAIGPADSVSISGDRLARVRDGVPEVVELATGAVIPLEQTAGHGTPELVVVNQGGRGAAVVRADGTVSLHVGKRFVTTKPVTGEAHARCVAISPYRYGWNTPAIVAIARQSGAIDLMELEGTNLAPVSLVREIKSAPSGAMSAKPSTLLAFSRAQAGLLASAGPASGWVNVWAVQARVPTDGPAISGQFACGLWHTDEVLCLGWNPSANELATGCRDGYLRFWKPTTSPDVPQTEPAMKVDLGEPIISLSWSPDASLVAVLLKSGRAKVYRPVGGQMLKVVDLVHKDATAISFVSGNRLFTWGPGGTRAWGPDADGQLFSQRFIGPGNVNAVYHTNGWLVAAAPALWHFVNPETLAGTSLLVTTDSRSQIMRNGYLGYFSEGVWKRSGIERREPDGIWYDFDYGIRDLDGTDVELASPFFRHTGQVRSLKLTLGQTNSTEYLPVTLPLAHRELVLSDWAPLSAWVAGDNTVHTFDHRSGRSATAPVGQRILGMGFSPAQPLLACRTEDSVVFVDPADGTQTSVPFPAAGPNLSPVAFSPDGKALAVVDQSGDLVVAILPASGAIRPGAAPAGTLQFVETYRFPSPSHHPTSDIAWAYSGDLLCAGTTDGFLQSWNLSLIFRKLRLYGLHRENVDPADRSLMAPVRLNRN